MNNLSIEQIPDNEYYLLTPGPLSTSKSVRAAMLKDWCTWDEEYKQLVQGIREKLLEMAKVSKDKYTTVLMQGSGTFSVEAVIGTAIGKDEKLLILENGAYGARISEIAKRLNIDTCAIKNDETLTIDLEALEEMLSKDKAITHVAVVHVETTTGMLNPIDKIGKIVNKYNKTYIVDSMSGFAGIHFDIEQIDIDFMISSANKCIQGVPGFGFIITKRESMKKCKGKAKSLSLDLYDQWKVMEEQSGKWRYTSPTHTVRAFYQALIELEAEGGVVAREARYKKNHKLLIEGMEKLGFEPILQKKDMSPIISSFYSPKYKEYSFEKFYNLLKKEGFVIYPGKVTDIDSFRIGNIGEVYPCDIERLIKKIGEIIFWK